jgi:hypothetical protein
LRLRQEVDELVAQAEMVAPDVVLDVLGLRVPVCNWDQNY